MSTKKMIIQKKETLEKILIEGANVLIKGFKTPANFLSFLTQALYWTSIEGVSEEKGADQTFFLRLVIDEVLQRWINTEERVNENVAIGLKEIQDWYGYEGYYDQISVILKGLAISIKEGGHPVKKYLDEYFKGVGVMFELGDHIRSYTIIKIREQKKISEAA